MHLRVLRHLHKTLKIKKELKEVYLNQTIELFATSLIGIFIPIYLLEQGFPIFSMLVYMILFWSPLCLFSFFSAMISSKVGVKHTILLRAPLVIVYFILLVYVKNVPEFLYPIAILGGISYSLYWVAINTEFVKNTDKIKEGTEVGLFWAFPSISMALAPFISALIILNFGFNFLFMVVVFLIFLAIVPLFLSRDYKGFFDYKHESLELKKNPKLSAMFFLDCFLYSGEFLIWHLFIFLKFGILSVGIAGSLSGFGLGAITVLIGKLTNKMENRKKLMVAGSMFYSLTWFARFFVSTNLEVFIFSFLGGLFSTMLDIPIYTHFCDFARKGRVLNNVVFREFWVNSARIVLVLITIFILLAFGVSLIFNLLFILFGITALLYLIFRK